MSSHRAVLCSLSPGPTCLVSELGFLFSRDPIFLVLLLLADALSFPCSILLFVALASLWTIQSSLSMSVFLATSAINVFLSKAHFMLVFTRAWRTCFLGLRACWLLSLQILAELDISSLGDLLSLSPEPCPFPCHGPPPLLSHRTWKPLFAAETSSTAQIKGLYFYFPMLLSSLVSYAFLCWGCSSILTV